MEFILLHSYGNYIEANIALSLLEQEGVRCYIEDESSGTLMHMSSGFRLMAYASQAERALEIIKNVELEYLKTIACPSCHHHGLEIKYVTEDHGDAVRKIPFGRLIGWFARLLTKEGTTMEVKHYVCPQCSKEFNELPV